MGLISNLGSDAFKMAEKEASKVFKSEVSNVVAKNSPNLKKLATNVLESDVFSKTAKKVEIVAKDTFKDKIKTKAKSLLNKTKVGKGLAKAKRNLANIVKTQDSAAIVDDAKKLINEPEKLKDLVNIDQSTVKTYNKVIRDRSRILMGGPVHSVVNAAKSKPSETIQKAIESYGVGFSKMGQIVSSNEEFLNKLPSEIRESIVRLRSDCTPTRNVEEAQKYINTVFGENKYKAQKLLGVGTVGETFACKTPEGKSVVVKMIKKGITKESMDAERNYFQEVIKNVDLPQKKKDYYSMFVNNLYDNWGKELDLKLELENTKQLSKGAKNFKVAQPIEFASGKKGEQAAAYEFAQGVPMDKLIDMVKTYKSNPEAYLQKYSKAIEKNPWLKNPSDWIDELPKSYLKAIDEQIYFAPAKGEQLRYMHGDPHPGNVFMNYDAETKKMMPTFIDAGLSVARDSKQITENLGCISSYFVGNSKDLAKRFLDQAMYVPLGKSQDELINEIAGQLDKKLFKANKNIRNMADNQKIIDSILEKSGVILSSENATFMKAELQGIMTAGELFHLNGKSLDPAMLVSDVSKGLISSIKNNPAETLKQIMSPMKHLINNTEDSAATAGQFILHP